MEKWTNLKSQQQKQGHLIITGEDGCCNRPVNYYMCPQNRRVKWSLPEQGGSLKAGKTASQRRELLSRAVEEGQTFTCQTGKTRHTWPVERPHHCYSESSRSSTQLKICQEGNRSSCMMGLCGSQSSLDYIPWGLKVWEIWLLGEGNSGHFLENKSSNRGQWRSFVPSTLERGGWFNKGSFLTCPSKIQQGGWWAETVCKGWWQSLLLLSRQEVDDIPNVLLFTWNVSGHTVNIHPKWK